MIVWLDAHLSPRLAHWMSREFQITAFPLRDLSLRDADDQTIYHAATRIGAVVLTAATRHTVTAQGGARHERNPGNPSPTYPPPQRGGRCPRNFLALPQRDCSVRPAGAAQS